MQTDKTEQVFLDKLKENRQEKPAEPAKPDTLASDAGENNGITNDEANELHQETSNADNTSNTSKDEQTTLEEASSTIAGDTNTTNTDKEVRSDAEEVELDADQLARLLGLESNNLIVDNNGKVKIKTKVNGQDSESTLQDLVRAYQTDAYLSNKGREVAKLEEQRKQELAEFMNRAETHAQQQAALLNVLKETYLQRTSEAELKILRESDPAEYAARKEEIRDKEIKLSNIASEATRNYEEAHRRYNEEQEKHKQTFLVEQYHVLEKSIPNFKTSLEPIKSHAMELGFSEKELNHVYDSRIVQALYESMQYRKGLSGAKTKLSKTLPKVLKPGARRDNSQISLDKIATQRAVLKKSGSIDDALALLKSMRKK